MRLGKIVGSRSHVDYTCQVFGPGDVADPPVAGDHPIGTFVRVVTTPGDALVGLVYDTQLLNPDFGSLGPRLSPKQDLAVFSPDYLNERAVLLGVMTVGSVSGTQVRQGLPALAATLDADVETMSEKEIVAFHRPAGLFALGYAPLVLAQRTPVAEQLLIGVLDLLRTILPADRRVLDVLRSDLAWRSRVEAVGGQL